MQIVEYRKYCSLPSKLSFALSEQNVLVLAAEQDQGWIGCTAYFRSKDFKRLAY